MQMIYSEQELDQVVELLLEKMAKAAVFTFTGSLGAGKTTLIRALLARLGVHEAITSPTFTYVNGYKNDQGQTFYHFDLYRLNSVQDFLEAGFDEYLYAPNSWCFIEWPQIIMPLLPKRVCHVVLDYYNQDKRLLQITVKE